MTHLFMVQKGGPFPESRKMRSPSCTWAAQAVYTENIPEQVQYAALGHLHRCKRSSAPCPLLQRQPSPTASRGNQEIPADTDVCRAKRHREKMEPCKPLSRRRAEAWRRLQWLSESKRAGGADARIDTFLTAKDRRRLNDAHRASYHHPRSHPRRPTT